MAFTYKYKTNMFKTPAEVAGEICQKLTESEEGLTPATLVEASRPVDAPMHDEFEWNDAVAGEKYREEQARMIIKNIVIVSSDIETERNIKAEIKDETTDRGFVSNGERKHQYVTLASALSNNEWRANLLEAAKKDMVAFKLKYYRLEELSEIIDDMNKFIGA